MEINDPLHIDIIKVQLDLTSMITRNSVFKDCHWKSNTCISFTEIMGFEEEEKTHIQYKKIHTHRIIMIINPPKIQYQKKKILKETKNKP